MTDKELEKIDMKIIKKVAIVFVIIVIAGFLLAK